MSGLQQAPPPTVVQGSSSVVKEGWLTKQGGKYKTWKKRWFILKNNLISYHKEIGKEPVGIITLSIVSSASPAPDYDKKGKTSHFRINVTDGRPGGAFLCSASDEETMNEWISKINETLEKYRKTGVGTNALSFKTKETKDETKEETKQESSVDLGKSHEDIRAASENKRMSYHPGPLTRKPSGAARLSFHPSIMKSPSESKKLTIAESFSDEEESEEDIIENDQASKDARAKEVYSAISSGNFSAVIALLQLGVTIDWRNENEGNRTLLHIAVQFNDITTVKKLLSLNASVNAKDYSGTTSLHLAAALGYSDCVELLLQQKSIDINILDDKNRSATYIATFTGHKKCAELLIELEIKNNSSIWTPLHLSVLRGEKIDVSNIQLENQPISLLHIAAAFDCIENANNLLSLISEKDPSGRSPLHYAAASGSMRVFKKLISSNSDTNDRDCDGKTPLHFASGLGRKDIVIELIRGGCMFGKDHSGFTPLHTACVQGQAESVLQLLNSPIDVNGVASDEITPLFLAAHSGNIDVISHLLEHKANINQRVFNNSTPLHECCRRKNHESLKLLLEKKANIEAIDENGNSPLLCAIKADSFECASSLIQAGADIHIRNNNKENALSMAINVENFEITYLLLERGLDCNDLAVGVTPLFFAAAKGNKDIVRLLLDYGAEVNFEDRWKSTPLLRAVSNGHSAIVEILLDAGANPNHQTTTGVTPLLEAAIDDSRIDCLELLLANGALPNVCNNEKSTALHEAASNGSFYSVSRLILFGASFNVKNKEQKTPLQLAAAKGHSEIVLLFLAYGASTTAKLSSSINSIMTSIAKSRGKERRRKKATRKLSKRKDRNISESAPIVDDKEVPVLQVQQTADSILIQSNTSDKEETTLSSNIEEDGDDIVNNENDDVEENKSEEDEEEESNEEDKEQDKPTIPAISKFTTEEETKTDDVSVSVTNPEDESADNTPQFNLPSPLDLQKVPLPPPITESDYESSKDKVPDNMSEESTPPTENAPIPEDEHEFAKKYIKQAQAILPKSDYKKFHKLLLAYKQEKILLEDLFEQVKQLLNTPETKELLQNFIAFLPDEHKAQYSAFISK